MGRAGVTRVPEDLRAKWDTERKLDRHNDIFEVEAVGPLLVLHNFGDVLAGSLWLHFVDNAAALSALVRGGELCRLRRPHHGTDMELHSGCWMLCVVRPRRLCIQPH